jgi:hypothetical protein
VDDHTMVESFIAKVEEKQADQGKEKIEKDR